MILQWETDAKRNEIVYGTPTAPSLSSQLEDKQTEILNKQLEKAGIAPVKTATPTTKMPAYSAGIAKQNLASVLS